MWDLGRPRTPRDLPQKSLKQQIARKKSSSFSVKGKSLADDSTQESDSNSPSNFGIAEVKVKQAPQLKLTTMSLMALNNHGFVPV
jgi:hypothetical protein